MFHLNPKPRPAQVRRPRHAGPRRRLLGGRDHAGHASEERLVHLLQERDRVQILAAAVLVRDPLPGLARVVEIEHRRDGVDADPVCVMLAQPVERVRQQEVLHLAAAEVEDERPPVRMRAAARVGVLVQMRAVERRERPVVAREVRGHPVEDDADAALVHALDERAEVVRVAEARRRREVAGDLVAPRSRERVLHHRQQLDVREAEVGHVVGELVRELAIRERAVVLERVAPPGAEVHLVDRHRLAQRLRPAARARATRRPTRRAPNGTRATRCRAGPRRGTRRGPPSAGGGRPACGSRTCSTSRARRRGRRAPRCRTSRATASGAGGRPRS